MWPREEVRTMIPEADPEIKKSKVNCAFQTQPDNAMNKLLTSFSDWNKLKRSVAYFILVKRHLQKKIAAKNGMKHENTDLRIDRGVLEDAEKSVVRYIQGQFYKEELVRLKQSCQTETMCRKMTLQKGSSLCKLDPLLDEGIIRVGGRLERAHMPYNAKHPIILPKASIVTKLLLEGIHKSTGHSGKNTMLATLRQNYWIPGAGTIIKGIVSKCVPCRKYKSVTKNQKMADLPADRLIPGDPPFTRVGVDYCGPFHVKRGRATVKRYGVIFTCLACRAVHIEIAHSLDTDSCINAIRRFVARRGPVKVMISDNGTNLVGAERVLREEIMKWNQSKIHKALLQDNIDWKFNPPYASHHGGIWERIIRSFRKILFSIMDHQVNHLDDECLQTLFCEAESILNGRPITRNSDHPSELAALTPNHLLLLSKCEVCPPGLFSREDNVVRSKWRQVQYLADQFWKRWVREYLPLLQERQKWCKTQRNISTGDIVLIIDNSPRHAWSLGRVTNVKRDKKGFVRIAEIKTQTGTLLRPITKLCSVLEADEL